MTGGRVPPQLLDAHYLIETGWPPDVLDQVPVERLEMYVLYKRVRDVVVNGGSLDPETGRTSAEVGRSPLEAQHG